MVAHPGARYPFQAQPLHESWICPEGDASLTGAVGTDGSLKGGKWRWLGRAGWAAAMVDADGALVAAVWGPLPHQLPVQRSIARAELQAVERALAHAVPPIVLHIDRQSILDGIAAGRAWCVCAARPDADLWMAVWRRIDDLGLGPTGVLFQKTKAHRSEAALQRLEADELRIARANAEADRLAG